MPDSISCPHCQRKLQVPDDPHIREVRCPECQQVFAPGVTTDITARSPERSAPPSTAVQQERPIRPERGVDDESRDDDSDLHIRIKTEGEFRSADGLALTLKTFLALNLLLGLATLGSAYLQYELAIRLVALQPVLEAEITGNDQRQFALGMAHLLVYVVTAIVFVVWFYRVHANLKPLGAGDLTYTSGWAAGCWFVPFLNLVRPLQIAQEIWRHSDPEVIRNRSTVLPGNSGLLGCWWAMWIISNIASNISGRMALAVTSPQSLKSASAAEMFAELVSILAALLALAVVASIDSRQTARAEAVGAKELR